MEDDSFLSVKANGFVGSVIAALWCGLLPVLGLLWLFGWLK